MPTLDVRIDSCGFRIQTSDLQMAGKWLADLLCLYKPMSHTYLQLQVSPFYVPDPADPRGNWIPDWDVDSSYFMNISACSAAEGLMKFAEQLARRAQELTPAQADTEVIPQW